jgi:hypothetical protein
MNLVDDHGDRVRIADIPPQKGPLVRLIEGRDFVIAVPDGPFARPYQFRLDEIAYRGQAWHWRITSPTQPTVEGTHTRQHLLLASGGKTALIGMPKGQLVLCPGRRGMRFPFQLTMPPEWRYLPMGEFYRLTPE